MSKFFITEFSATVSSNYFIISPLYKRGDIVMQSVRTYVRPSVVSHGISGTIKDRNLKLGMMKEYVM